MHYLLFYYYYHAFHEEEIRVLVHHSAELAQQMFRRFLKYLIRFCQILGTEYLLVQAVVSHQAFAGVAFAREWCIHVWIRRAILIDLQLLLHSANADINNEISRYAYKIDMNNDIWKI